MPARQQSQRRSRSTSAAAVSLLALMLAVRVEGDGPGLATLAARLTQIAESTRGELGVSLVHVESGAELFSFNGSKPFAMASVYKLPIAFEALAQISERRLAFDQLIDIRAS